MQKLPPTVRDTLRGLALDSIYWSNKAQTICENHAQLYRFAADWIGAEIPVSYVEFGVAHGGTMRAMTRLFSNSQSEFFGFDSFIGLPEDWLMHAKGAFSNGGHEPDVSDERVSFVKGWFQNTLPGFFDTKKLSLTKPILVHFDADLYSSTLFLLTTLWHQIPEYYFIFDDFIHDDNVALDHFMSAYPVDISFFAQTRGGGEGPNPDQVFGKMSRTSLIIDGL